MSILRAYQQQQHQFLSPLTQVAALLIKAAEEINQASIAIAEGRPYDRFLAADKAIKILQTISASIGSDEPALAPILIELDFFFKNIYIQIIEINQNPTEQACQDIIDKLQDMAIIWRQADGRSTPDNQPHV